MDDYTATIINIMLLLQTLKTELLTQLLATTDITHVMLIHSQLIRLSSYMSVLNRYEGDTTGELRVNAIRNLIKNNIHIESKKVIRNELNGGYLNNKNVSQDIKKELNKAICI